MLKHNIILCDDRADKYELLRKLVFPEEELFQIVHVSNLNELVGLLSVANHGFEAIFLDLYYPDADPNDDLQILSINSVKKIKALCQYAKIIVFTAHNDEKTYDLMKKLLRLKFVDDWLDSKVVTKSQRPTDGLPEPNGK